MQDIAGRIHEGAMVFLKREYSILAIFIIVVFILLWVFMPYQATALAFLSGTFCSLLCGLFGMQAATLANVRTAQAAKEHGQGRALLAAFNGGAVMGLSVASLGLVGFGSPARGPPGRPQLRRRSARRPANSNSIPITISTRSAR